MIEHLVLIFVLSTNLIPFAYRDPPSASYLELSTAFMTNIHCINNDEFGKFISSWFAQDKTGHKIGDLMTHKKFKMANLN